MVRDETNAYYAEQVLGNKYTLEKLLEAEPTLKDKILSFFKGASTDYADVPKLVGAAKKYYRTYKKLFDEFSARNYESNALENAHLGSNFEKNTQKMSITGVKSDKQYAFAGANARTADKMKLTTAEQMLKDGTDSETVRRETGWFKGYDGKWRFEIDDSQFDVNLSGYFTNPDVKKYKALETKFLTEPENMTEADIEEFKVLSANLKGVKKTPSTLGDYVKHDALFKAYPELRDIKLKFDKIDSGGNGKYISKSKEIVLDNSIRNNKSQLKETLIHEIQHVVAEIEGFSRGSSVKYWDNQRSNISEDLKAARENLDFWLKDIGYSDYVKQSMSEVSSKKKTLNQHWQDIENFKNESKYAKQIKTSENEIAKLENRLKELTNGKTSYELYENTAGEIEARDAAERINLSAEQRKNTRPDVDRTDVVFAGDSQVSYFAKNEYDAETAGIKDQIRNSQDLLNKMEVVYSGNVPTHFENRLQSKKWAVEELSKRGFKADRQGFGVIEFSEKDIYGALDHLDSNEERAAIAAIYHVLKRGIQIGEHGNHKLRQKHTVTFAGPVEINGVRGNMAVVVNMRNKKYYVHRIIMPDGSAFRFVKNENANQEAQRGVPKGSLANATRFASVDIISQPTQKSNTSGKKSLENSSGKQYALDIDSDDGNIRGAEVKPKEKPKAKKKSKVKSKKKAQVNVDPVVEKRMQDREARMKARYETDTEFTKSSVKDAFSNIKAVRKLPYDVQNEILRNLWLDLETSDDQEVRNTFILKYSTELYFTIKNATKNNRGEVYDIYDNMNTEQRNELQKQLEEAVRKAVNSGRASILSENCFVVA